ncbi:hypothetical protein KP509_05G088400 [Ceratopteris richardii]|uniref:Nuclear pore complex protein Nup85 n=1 Tax=Ceratopteris richardii TaxID=49495 RepID=A0A8T2USQ2_CERRI|nr:hypothetical protein KP509_05G088400 [Ceratopteris richardii]
MPGWPDSDMSFAGEKSIKAWSSDSASAKVCISWGTGNKLRLSYLHPRTQEISSTATPSKVVEVKVGSVSSHESAMRRLVYDSLPAFALLQNRKQQALRQSQRGLPSDWWETVLQYSRSISVVLGANKSSSGSVLNETSEMEKRTLLRAIWDLLEIVYVDKHASSWLTEQLTDWLERYDQVLSNVEPTVNSKLSVLKPKLINTRVKYLRMHGSYQHDQIDNRQTENGLVEAVAVLISKMPRLQQSSKTDTVGVTYTFKPEFSKAWERWRNQISKLVTSVFWLECTHEGTANGLKQLLSILLGDTNILISATTHWMELLVSHVLFVKPFLMGSEGLLSLARKCMQLKPPIGIDQLTELLLAIIGENTEVVLVECRKHFDPWMVTHMLELLSAKNGQAQSFLTEERDEFDGLSLEEFHRLVYAQILSSYPCTWQLTPFYLASGTHQGQGLLEAILLMRPVSSDSKVSAKVLDICRMYDLHAVAERYKRMMGVYYWKHGRKGLGISWLQCGRDYSRLTYAANELFTDVSQASVGDSGRLQELDSLIDLLGPQFEGFGGLAFLHRFRDFKGALFSFQEGLANSISFDKQVVAGKTAVKHLMQLMKDGITADKFLLPLLQDAVELLNFSGEVLVSSAETNILLLRLQNLTITNKHDTVLDLSSESVAKIRLALGRNLGRAILKD